MTERIGILHPGEMGVFVAASAANGGHVVRWVSEGRSPATQRRARERPLVETSSLEELCERSTIILSVCPPHAAEEVARQVLAHSFRGLYGDLNAISPTRTIRLCELMASRDIEFVDGGIIGGPDWTTGTTRLYLAGRAADRIAACFTAGPLQAAVLGDRVGKASALKMCYAAYSKGTTALLSAILAAAEKLEVREELERRWSADEPGFADQAEGRARRVTAKAWRYAGEMEEIAATFSAVGLPGGFHEAAAELYRRLAPMRGRTVPPELSDVLDALLGETPPPPRRSDGPDGTTRLPRGGCTP